MPRLPKEREWKTETVTYHVPREGGGWTSVPALPAVDAEAPLLAPQVADTPSLADREPVAIAGAIQGVLSATLAVVLGFGWVTLTDQQIGLLLGLYTAVVAAVQAFARGRAWSPASVARLTARREP